MTFSVTVPSDFPPRHLKNFVSRVSVISAPPVASGARLNDRNIGSKVFKDPVQSGAPDEGLGWVDLDLGCSTILLGQ